MDSGNYIKVANIDGHVFVGTESIAIRCVRCGLLAVPVKKADGTRILYSNSGLNCTEEQIKSIIE